MMPGPMSTPMPSERADPAPVDLNDRQRRVLRRLAKTPTGIRRINTWPMADQWAVEYLLSLDLIQGKVRTITDAGRAALDT